MTFGGQLCAAGSYWTASLHYRALRGDVRLGRAIGRGYDVVDDR
jgi:hypothetical protein